MQIEEAELLPVAGRVLSAEDRHALDVCFNTERDPLAAGQWDLEYEALFSRIAQKAPAPLGIADE